MHTPGVRWPAGLLATLLAVALVGQASAQTTGSARLSPPVTDTFPSVRVYLDVRDDQGRRVSGLRAADVSLTEDEIAIPGVSLTEAEVGVRQVIVLNTSDGLRVRDTGGRSRYDVVRDALLGWWQNAEASPVGVDDLSLVAAEGTLALHRASAAELAARLDSFRPTFDRPAASLDLLMTALRGPAADARPPGRPTHVLFVTGLIETPRDLPVAEAVRLANQTGSAVHVILLGPASALDLPAAASLRLLAQSTGGDFLLLEPGGSLAELGSRIAGQRVQYELAYTSPARTSGTHSLQAMVTRGDLDLASSASLYTINLQPTEVVFISPPTAVTRQPGESATRVEDLEPTFWPIEVLVTFPDGHPRDLVTSQLLIDGRAVAENTQPPFDRFTWDLRGISQSGWHVLSVAVEDQQGLRGVTAPISVQVEVVPPPRGLAALRPAMAPLLGAIGVLLVGVVVIAALTASGRRLSMASAPRPVQSEPRRPLLRRAGLQRLAMHTQPEAHLVWENAEGEPIALIGIDLTFGRDAALASIVLDDASVAGLHARLIRLADGSYVLKDQGSTAGTYVNFTAIPESGQRLRHGDRVHIGRLTFRFRLAEAPPPRPVQVTSATGFGLPPKEPRA
jgi:hypothetical protein